MKVELQSESSDFGEFDDVNRFRRSSVFDQRKNLWNNKTNTVSNDPSPHFYSERNKTKASDEDFEFVITKSKNAMKVKRAAGSSSDGSRRFSNGLDSSKAPKSRFNSRNDSPIDKSTHHKRKPVPFDPIQHPGLQRNINFNPFDSSDDESSGNSEVYDVRRYSTYDQFNDYSPASAHQNVQTNHTVYPHQRTDSFEVDRYHHGKIVLANQPRRSRYRPGYRKFFTKLKCFFKTVGFKIRKCFSRSKIYLFRMIKDRKAKRRARKARERLLSNQEYLGEDEPNDLDDRKSPRGFRQKLSAPFNTRSVSTSSFEDVDTTPPKKKLRFPGFRNRDSRRSRFFDSKKTIKHVKLHSFPDG